MPKQMTTSGLLRKIQASRNVFEEKKTEDIKYDEGGQLPAGIENGIAQLVECKFDTYKKGDNVGEYFFYAAGIVLQPREQNGVSLKGLRTSIIEALCDTPKSQSRPTQGDHLTWVMNEMKKLGVDMRNLALENLESTAEALKEAKPFFRFRTWKGAKATEGPYKDKEPRVQHVWNGAVEYSEDADAGAGVTEGAAEDSDDVAVEEPPAKAPPKTQPTPSKNPPKPPKKAPPATEEPDFDEKDLITLAKKAAKDEEAATSLTAFAVAAGFTEEEVESAENWQQVVEMIKRGKAKEEANSSNDESEEVGEEGETITPSVEDVFGYAPINSKTGKKGKVIQCEVTKVDKKSSTVILKNLEDESVTYKSIPFASLVQSE